MMAWPMISNLLLLVASLVILTRYFVTDVHSDGMEGGDAQSDEATLMELRCGDYCGTKSCCALEGALVLRLGQKRVLEYCLDTLMNRSRGKESKRKR